MQLNSSLVPDWRETVDGNFFTIFLIDATWYFRFIFYSLRFFHMLMMINLNNGVTSQRLPLCHQMETFSTIRALCVGNSPGTSEFFTQRSVMRSFDAFFDLNLNKQLSKQSRHWWFEMPLHSLWHHCNASFLRMGNSMAFLLLFINTVPINALAPPGPGVVAIAKLIVLR